MIFFFHWKNIQWNVSPLGLLEHSYNKEMVVKTQPFPRWWLNQPNLQHIMQKSKIGSFPQVVKMKTSEPTT